MKAILAGWRLPILLLSVAPNCAWTQSDSALAAIGQRSTVPATFEALSPDRGSPTQPVFAGLDVNLDTSRTGGEQLTVSDYQGTAPQLADDGAKASDPPDLTRSANDDQGVIEINDPTSPLRWFQLSDWYNASLHDESGTINNGVFRTVLPFTLRGDLYAVRFTQQYQISAYNGKTGFQDPELILVRLIHEAWGRWLVGLVVRPPTGAESQTSHAWSLGPALGLATSSEAAVQYGIHLRAWWSVDSPSYAKPVGIINLQPVLNIKLGNGQALSLGQSQLEYDTVKSRWKSLQLGVKYDKAFTIADRKWTPYFETDYDFENSKGNPMWTLRVGITMFEQRK